MKYWRRHKHEILHTTSDEPLPLPPAKKMRYGRYDDILLAKWLVNKPTMTSDKMFQEFARLVCSLHCFFASSFCAHTFGT